MSLAAFGTSTGESVSQSIVEAVAEAEGVAPEELAPPLYEVIDPDALGRLFASTSNADRGDGRVTFRYAGHDVTVESDGAVSVEESDATAE